MSVKDLITKWEYALAEALTNAIAEELSDEDLEKVPVPSLPAATGLRVGASGCGCNTSGGTWIIT